MANVERHARLPVPTGVLALEEMAEESLLQRLAVAAVEVREMCVAVDLQPFLLGARAQEAFEIATRVQTHAHNYRQHRPAQTIRGHRRRHNSRCQMGDAMRNWLDRRIPDTTPYKEWLDIVGSMVAAVAICAVLFAGGLLT